MPRKKCPICGSTESLKILYGMPTYEAFEASERGELALGGCCVLPNSPTRRCKQCGNDFGSNDILRFLSMTSFEFFIGGFFGTSYTVTIDATQENKVIFTSQISHDFSELSLIPPIHLNIEQWNAFLDDLNSLDLSCWKDKYVDDHVLDGTQWSLEISFSDDSKFSIEGSNDYPPYWNKLLKIMRKYVHKDIG